ncbi:uncharacterized protein A1O9_07948 [Exophiala aquamarina CBS 119918]|uniref:Nicotinamide-nucleotide adenylyltransferase n=1 Tax=Exophiala aquamarina CBS 119918 TaxID=1182545 RepID=A0A072P9F0_9EURO|nr:uncharacterized protein A1O9_07948 [Exophiala aquamarina CBS 119918]KEF56367.1 hypothetical protein A1O9_07948 [Exophiala aquamarina CBS 119918]
MPTDKQKMQSLQALRSQFSQALKELASSTSSFRILQSIPSSHPPSSSLVSTLFVLDSSFNPPSKAHSRLVKSALSTTRRPTPEESPAPALATGTASSHAPPPPPLTTRVLFLLATVNADKKPKPADFEDRLVMMTLMAEELREEISNQISPSSSQPQPQQPAPVIDIGITKEPYFIDKATSIAESNLYTTSSSSNHLQDDADADVVEQVHITGFDTLTRIFTSRYYPKHDPPLSALEPFLSRHRIHATVRVESSSANDDDLESEFGTVEKQKGYWERLARGALEDEGLKREWMDQVQLVVDESGEADGVSSTSARECVKGGQIERLGRYVGEGVKEWILERGLYRS